MTDLTFTEQVRMRLQQRMQEAIIDAVNDLTLGQHSSPGNVIIDEVGALLGDTVFRIAEFLLDEDQLATSGFQSIEDLQVDLMLKAGQRASEVFSQLMDDVNIVYSETAPDEPSA